MALVDCSPSVSPLASPDIEWDAFITGWSPRTEFPSRVSPNDRTPSLDASYFASSNVQANYHEQPAASTHGFPGSVVNQFQERTKSRDAPVFRSFALPEAVTTSMIGDLLFDDLLTPVTPFLDKAGLPPSPRRSQFVLTSIGTTIPTAAQENIDQTSIYKERNSLDSDSNATTSPPASFVLSSKSSPQDYSSPVGSSPQSFVSRSQSTSVGKKRKLGIENTATCTKQWKNGASTIQWGLSNRETRKKTTSQLQKYRINRGIGPCEKCSKHKKGCDRSCFPYIECLKQRSLRFLDRPETVRMFRSRPCNGHPLASERKCIYDLGELSITAPEIIEMKITQGTCESIQVQVNQFEAHPDFKTKRVWLGGELEMPRLGLTSLRKTRAAVEVYIWRSWLYYLEDIMKDSSHVVRNVLYEAQRFSMINKNSMVHRALMLLAVNRMIERDWTISPTSSTMRQFIVDNARSPWHGKIPITPVMDTQLDQIIIQDFLVPLRRNLVLDLQEKMDKGLKQDWFEIFLVVFVLSTNTELLLRHSRSNAVRCGAQRRYNSIELAQEYFHGTNILLAHFHHCCSGNKVLLGLSSKTAGNRIAGLQDHQVAFLQTLQHEIEANKIRLLHLRDKHSYEAELFWSHQLFFEDWKPEDRNIVDEA